MAKPRRPKFTKSATPKPTEFDVALPEEYQFKPARPTPPVSDPNVVVLRCVGGMAVPHELLPFLLPDHKPRPRCSHCGTVLAAMMNYHSDTCSCLCHAARRFDAARLKA